jgi:hypothetical protein
MSLFCFDIPCDFGIGIRVFRTVAAIKNLLAAGTQVSISKSNFITLGPA